MHAGFKAAPPVSPALQSFIGDGANGCIVPHLTNLRPTRRRSAIAVSRQGLWVCFGADRGHWGGFGGRHFGPHSRPSYALRRRSGSSPLRTLEYQRGCRSAHHGSDYFPSALKQEGLVSMRPSPNRHSPRAASTSKKMRFLYDVTTRRYCETIDASGVRIAHSVQIQGRGTNRWPIGFSISERGRPCIRSYV